MKKVYLGADETTIKQRRLDELRKKERAHDAFMEGYQRLQIEQAAYLYAAERTPRQLGWLDCFRSLNDGIIEASKNIKEDTTVAKEYADPTDRMMSTRRPRSDYDDLPF